MSKTSLQILEILADGDSHSGEIIGQALGISRMAVSKAIKGLAGQGLDIVSVPGKGYQLNSPVQLLDEQAIRMQLDSGTESNCQIEILTEIHSTSDYLLEQAKTRDIHKLICLAESQDSGRGRRQRGWYATAYRNVILSMGWRFDDGMAGLSGLGVAAGIRLVRALHEAGFSRDIGLKWPNDIVYKDQKLGGLLIDVRGEHDGPCTAVLGLGLNLSMSAAELALVDQPAVSLEQIAEDAVDRNYTIFSLLGGLLDLFENYAQSGFEKWQPFWQDYDQLYGREVNVLRGGTVLTGVARGIDESGALLLEEGDQKISRFLSGDVSLRLAG